MSTVLRTPAAILLLVLLGSSWLGWLALDFGDQIEGEVEIYLPDGAESTDLLAEVRESWTTDVMIVYITTDNRALGGGVGHNVTNVAVLEEISRVEGDDRISGSGPAAGIDWDRSDRGRNDGVIWVLSISQVIKEANSSDVRFRQASCSHGLESRLTFVDCSLVEQDDTSYSIPDQDRVDRTVGQLSESLSSLAVDTNGDGIWDTTAIAFGLIHDMQCEDCTTEFIDGRDFSSYLDVVIENRAKDPLTQMEVTGLGKILNDVSDRIYDDLQHMMPISLAFVVLVLAALHRDPRIVLITGVPVVLSLAITLGLTVALDILLTPMIIAAAPILIGLGVDYALHLASRFEEARIELIESSDNLRDAWDFDVIVESAVRSTLTTGRAVVLSAGTTIIGFGMLIVPFLTPIPPMRTVGMTLVIGIAVDLVLSIILVPVMISLLRYQRSERVVRWTSLGRFPVRRWAPILIVVVLISAASGSMLSEQLGKPITAASETPENIPSMEAMKQYSREFQSGQISMFIVNASKRGGANGTTPIRDLAVLDSIDHIESEIDRVQSTNTTSVVAFLKSIHVELNFSGIVLEDSLWGLLHHKCWESNDLDCSAWVALDLTDPNQRAGWRADLVDVSLDTLSDEVRALLLDEDEERSLVYVNQRYMNLIIAGGLRDQIDEKLTNWEGLPEVQVSRLTGGLPVSLDVDKGIHDAQSRTTIFTLISLFAALLVVRRSFRGALLIMAPVGIIVLWQPLLMWQGEVNVNIFTAMIGTIVLGIGVDDAIHIAERIREEGETPRGIERAVERTGKVVFETSLTTIAGLSAGFFLAFPGLVNFFVLMIALIALAFVSSVLVLPALISGERTLASRISGFGPWYEDDDAFGLTAEIAEAELIAPRRL